MCANQGTPLEMSPHPTCVDKLQAMGQSAERLKQTCTREVIGIRRPPRATRLRGGIGVSVFHLLHLAILQSAVLRS